jgi:Tol biopolymer transport system component
MEERMRRAMIISVTLAALCGTPAMAAETIDWTILPKAIDGPGGEAWLTRHPDGTVIVFGRHDKDYQNHRLFMTRLVDGKWTEPAQLPFTRDLNGTAPHFSPDGKSMTFLSQRALDGGPNADKDPDNNIWRVTWDGTNWGEPKLIPLDSPNYEIDAVEVANGTIYFTSQVKMGSDWPKPDLFKAVPTDKGYRVEALTQFNTTHTESTIYVTPDESMIFFHRDGDPVGLGKDDLFAAKRVGDGWGPAIHLQGATNSPGFDYGPELSRDGSTLYFTTHRSGTGAIMAVSLKEALGR